MCAVERCEVSVQVSSLKGFTFLSSITLVLLGSIGAVAVCEAIRNDAERRVVKGRHFLAKALDLMVSDTSVAPV